MKLRKAVSSDIDAVSALYGNAVGVNNSVWDENYPTRSDAELDLQKDMLYVFEDNGVIIGACSAETESGFEELDVWQLNDGSEIYIARIVIATEHHGKGLGAVMTKALIASLAERGYRSVRLFAAKANPAAVKTYKNVGFTFLGECFGFGHDYLAAEYIIKEDI